MKFFGRNKFEIKEEVGIIIGYEITDKIFKPVLELAKKGKQGWKLPIFIKSLVDNPSPLLLEEYWLYDQGAVNRAITWLKSDGVKGVDKLDFLFEESKRFEPVSMQTIFNEHDDVDTIVNVMKTCEQANFWETIESLEKAYGNYAYPNNYEFERMNAGIIKCLSVKFPNLFPLDDSLRAPVYEYLGSARYEEFTKGKGLIERIVRVTQDSLLPIPEFKSDWDPVEFIKLHKSKGAKQLRDIVKSIRAQQEINDQNLAHLLDKARALSLSLSPTRNVVYAFVSLGATVLSAIQAVVNPYMYVPAVIFTLISADQFYMTLQSRIGKEQLRWLDVADQLAKWCILRQEGS